MDYKEKVIALLNSKELSQEQKEKLESIFPELAESEDERIRKRLIEYFEGYYDRFATDRNHVNVHWEGLEVKKVLAWLEKQCEKKNAWSEEDDDDAWLNDIISKAECDLQLNKDEIDWLKSIKGRIQPKQEWSEEDENRKKTIIHLLSLNGRIKNDELIRINDWLESLKPRNRWKPSDNQMKALDMAIRCGIQLGTWEEDALKSLYQELMYKARDEHFKMF